MSLSNVYILVPGKNQLYAQENGFFESSELVPSGLPYKGLNHADFISIHEFTVHLQVHAQPFMGNRRLFHATEDQFVPCRIWYSYQSTEPFDVRNCKLNLPPIQQAKVGIQETTGQT